MLIIRFIVKLEKIINLTGWLVETVENLVRKWEMEVTQKANMYQSTTIDLENFCVQSNGSETIDGLTLIKCGTYNGLFKGCSTYKNCEHLTLQ